jgi:hypothetical protein
MITGRRPAMHSPWVEAPLMKLTPVRFTVRRMMVAVALNCISMGVTREVRRLGRQSLEYRRRAVTAAREQRGWRQAMIGRVASEVEAQRLVAVLRTKDQDLADLWVLEASVWSRAVSEVREVVAFHARLRQKYQRAASRPWEPVEPDPPEPRETHVWQCVRTPKEPLPPGQRWYVEDAERRPVPASSR